MFWRALCVCVFVERTQPEQRSTRFQRRQPPPPSSLQTYLPWPPRQSLRVKVANSRFLCDLATQTNLNIQDLF